MVTKDKFILAILLAQPLVESLFFWLPLNNSIDSPYFILMRLLHIGFVASVFLWIYSEGALAKVLTLSLVIYTTSPLILELVALANNNRDLVLTITEYDKANYLFIFIAVILSTVTNAILYSRSGFFGHILALLRKNK